MVDGEKLHKIFDVLSCWAETLKNRLKYIYVLKKKIGLNSQVTPYSLKKNIVLNYIHPLNLMYWITFYGKLISVSWIFLILLQTS